MKHLPLSMIGVSLDLGQSRRGVDMGPSAIRYAGVVERLEALGHDVVDEGDVRVDASVRVQNSDSKLKNLQEVIQVNTELAKKVATIVKNDRFPLVLGGDHSVAIGTIAGLASHYDNLGVIWYDAHADMNTDETTPSGNIHGMPLAISMGYGDSRLVNLHHRGKKVKPENIVLIGARSIDEGERRLIKKRGIQVYTMHEIDRCGMAHVMKQAIQYLQNQQVDGVHLSLDLDALDPLDAPGVGTPVAGGMSYRESHLAMEMLEESKLITSAEFVEVNPILDERNRTADTAVELMGSLFGEKLL